MHTALARQALQSGHCLEVRYDGYVRIVEGHACGWTKEGHAVMRVWQVRGGSVSNEPVGWKLLRLDETVCLVLLYDVSGATRHRYNRGDRAIKRILCQSSS